MKNKVFSMIGALSFLFVMWYIGSIALNKPFLPTPWEAITGLFYLFQTGEITGHFLTSSYRVFASIGVSLLLGVPLGLFLGENKTADRLISPLIYVLYPLPKVVFLPIIVVLLGLGDLPKIFLITLVIFFQIVVAARDSAKTIPFGTMQSIKSLNPSKLQIYVHLVFPYCLPQIFTALRVSLGIAIAILFFAESFASTSGLGYYILDAMDRRSYDLMYGGILAMGILGIVAYKLVDMAEAVFCRWQKY